MECWFSLFLVLGKAGSVSTHYFLLTLRFYLSLTPPVRSRKLGCEIRGKQPGGLAIPVQIFENGFCWRRELLGPAFVALSKPIASQAECLVCESVIYPREEVLVT
ncbi:hypothetical protein L6452_32908 [Arctium lappa]|uniref:Uncharacterized protein n=1 Tax=Arctium lappa TaxID=4217 RepID=A0ACB8Z5T9_ARCLA|nr:hypothetical protein L6452_32908 [Arctium lappa]